MRQRSSARLASGTLTVRSFADAPRRSAAFVDRLRADQWVLGTATVALPDLLVAGTTIDVRWSSSARRGTFLADPFPLSDTELLCEEFSHRSARGRLVTVESCRGGLSGPRRVELAAEHLSYPFVVHDAGRVYVVPERSYDGGIHLYELRGSAMHHLACLVADEPLLDPTLLAHDGTWYLFASVDTPLGDELHVWCAAGIDGPWRPHPASPLAGRGATLRPAGGLLHVGGRLVRPSQDCRDGYGAGVILNVVDELTPDGFQETPTAVLTADTGRYTDGLHTLNVWGDRLVVDGKRRRFRADHLIGRARRRVRRRLRRHALG